ncbi:hypothetical protein GCM10023086_44130 [Streptomyces venetus]|uniref:Uncharacterized protein n=1 Tax=Streptomyces venetus TaxID=1701086 RepID=A0ABP8G9C3_9ACTN
MPARVQDHGGDLQQVQEPAGRGRDGIAVRRRIPVHASRSFRRGKRYRQDPSCGLSDEVTVSRKGGTVAPKRQKTEVRVPGALRGVGTIWIPFTGGDGANHQDRTKSDAVIASIVFEF